MPQVKDVYEYIDSIAPFSTQLPFDNAGLLCGDVKKQVDSIGVCLDITKDAVQYAAEHQAQLIVSHHPVIFNPINKILADSAEYSLVSNGISAICAHTNLDAADGGVNDVLCEYLKLSEISPLYDDEYSGFPAIARVAELPENMTAPQLAEHCKESLKANGVRFVDAGKNIGRVAVCSGAGGDMVKAAYSASAQALITGEIKHHEMLLALSLGLSVIECGHFASENIIVESLVSRLKGRFGCEVFAIPQDDPIKYV